MKTELIAELVRLVKSGKVKVSTGRKLANVDFVEERNGTIFLTPVTIDLNKL